MRHVLEVALVALVAFGSAYAWREIEREGGLQVPAWVPYFGDPLIDWKPDAVTREYDLRQVRGAAAHMPMVWEPPTAPNIVVIVLDTVRADRMGLYGYTKGTTPRIDRWAEGARVYDRMVSDATWTLPAHASLFTGRPVVSHGARGVPAGDEIASPLAPRSKTVARALKQAGYSTAGIAANRAFLHEMWGLSQGFDLWLCEELKIDPLRLPYTSADRITAMAEAFLERPREAPVFLFLNYMDAHAPWLPRRGYVADPVAIHPRYLPYTSGWTRATERLMALGEQADAATGTWSEAYDGELRFLDEHVGELLERLPSLGIGDDDYVFVLSDHGEYLGEHDLVEHSKDVYDQVLRVPLLVRGPGFTPGRDADPIQTHDVASLILGAVGQQPLDGAVRTQDLQVSEQYWARQRDLANPMYGKRFDRIRRAFRLGDHTLLLGSDGSREAYDIGLDPGELRDLVRADWVPALEARAESWLEDNVAAPAASVEGSADVESLRALGYTE